MVPPAVGGRRPQGRFEVLAGATTFLEDCGLPFRANPALRNDAQRWALLTRRVVNPLVADLPDPDAAARLILKGYRPNTQRSYMSKCRGFFSYCKQYNRDPLPASMPTVIGYVLHELERGALAPPSLSKYLSAVASLHLLAGHPDPTKDKLVQLAVFGFRASALERAGGELELQRMPLPAEFILRVCKLGLATPNDYLSLQCAGLVLGYVLFNRPGAAACMRRCDVAFTTHGMELQVVDFKMALRTGRERLAFTVPIGSDPAKPDKVAQLLRLAIHRHDASGRHPQEMLFADPAWPAPARRFWLAARVTNKWLRRAMELLPLAAPLGGKYQGHSLRSGAGSEAYAIGIPLPMIAEMMGHASIETKLRSYVKTRWRASPAAWEVLGRFAPRLLRL